MKKIFTIAAIAAATVLSASCAKEIEGEFQKEGIIAHASLQPVEATKAIGEYSYNIVWEENDKIAVLDNASNKASFKLTDGARTTSGTFQQEGTDALTAPLTAYYPASVVAEDKSLVWPATQADVKNISNVPMTASSPTATGEVNFAFKHLGSVLQLVLTAKNGEINVKQIDITADQGLSGAFTVENGAAVISNTGTTISTGDISDKNIKLSATASYLNFAVPSGSFTNFAITITDTNDKEYSLSAASLTLERAMVNKVTFAMDAKDPAVFEVNVNGHTVRVKLSETDEGIADDVLTNVKVDGGNVIIKANSFQDKLLICSVEGDAHCERTITNGKFTFTISSIYSEIIAVLAYAPYVEVKVLSDTNGKVWIGDDENKTTGQFQIGQQVVIHAAPNDNFRLLRWNDNNRETSRTITVGDTDTEYSASFISSDLIPGLFTVSSGKQVFFSKGNLYCSGVTFYGNGDVASMANAKWGFEANQYDTNPTTYQSRDPKHISHFLWCADESNAVCEKYNNDWNENGVFLFTNADATTPNPNFAVNGKQGYWRVLSGGTGGEWDYLLNTRTMENSKPRYTDVFGVSIGGVTCNGLFIYPDDYNGNEIGSGGPGTWADINAAGIVFLPAAGYRNGDPGYSNPANVFNVGNYGYYWSASPDGYYRAFDLYFVGGRVTPFYFDARDRAYSVRLVTESN